MAESNTGQIADIAARGDATGNTVDRQVQAITGASSKPVQLVDVAMGELHWAGNAAATVITTGATYTKCAPVAGTLGVGMQFDKPADGRLRYIGERTRTFHMGCTLTVSSAGASDVLKAVLYKNGAVNGSNEYTSGTALTAGTIGTKTASGTDIISTAIHVMVELKQNDYIELAIQNVTDTDDLTVADCNLFAVAMIATPDGYLQSFYNGREVAIPFWYSLTERF